MRREQYEAREIISTLYSHSEDAGGFFTEITGGMGSFKTGALLLFADYAMNNHPTEKCFFSEAYYAPLQSMKLKKDKIQYFIKKDSGVYFTNRDTGKETNLKQKVFKDYADLYEQAQPGKLNVVFFGSRLEWMQFIAWLRTITGWVHVFIDEMSEICPAWEGGDLLSQIKEFARVCKDIRKCMMNVFYNTQTAGEIDWRVRKKIMCHIYLPGAHVNPDSGVWQKAVGRLQKDTKRGNQAWLEMPGMFGLTRFEKFYKPIKGQHYDARIRRGEE